MGFSTSKWSAPRYSFAADDGICAILWVFSLTSAALSKNLTVSPLDSVYFSILNLSSCICSCRLGCPWWRRRWFQSLAMVVVTHKYLLRVRTSRRVRLRV